MDTDILTAPKTNHCQQCSLANLCLPLGLDEASLDMLDALIDKRRNINAHEPLFRQGEAFQHLFAVRAGAFKASFITPNGEEHITAFYLPGDLIGLDALHKERYGTTVTALDISSVCELDFAKLFEYAAKIPALQRHILNLMSHHMAPEQHVNINASAEQRLSGFLLHLSERFHRRGLSASNFILPMARQDLGNYLGLAPETISRLFQQFKQEGILEVNRRELSIKDLRALQKLSCFSEQA